MSNVIAWVEFYHTQILTGGFFVLQGITVLLLILLAHRVRIVRRQIRGITEQVEHYLSVVMDAENPKMSEKPIYTTIGKSREDEESRLISSVLREIFP